MPSVSKSAFYATVLALALGLSAPGSADTNTSAPAPSVMPPATDLVVPATQPFDQQVHSHALLLDKLKNARDAAVKNKSAADARKDFDSYKSAETDLTSIDNALTPYSKAFAQSKDLVAAGYKLDDFSGKVCRTPADCRPIDPITAVFFFSDANAAGLGPSMLQKKTAAAKQPKPQGPNPDVTINGFDVSVLFMILADKPLDFLTFGIVPGVRDAIIPPDDNGEIAKVIRDPIKRPIEIIQNGRDAIIPPSDNGEVAKIIRDPIKCTVGRLFGGC